MKRPDEDLIENVLAGLANENEARYVARWFATKEGTGYLSERFDRESTVNWQGFEELFVEGEIPTEKVWETIQHKINRKRRWKRVFQCAAILIPVVLIVGIGLRLNMQVDLFGNTKIEELYVPKGERMTFAFQDGSKVYLNSDTRLRYPGKFGLDRRKISIVGDGYFEIVSNPFRPFIVQMGGLDVEVYGTKFHVSSYSDCKDMVVRLDEGKVSMRLPNKNKISLLPGELLVYHRVDGTYRLSRRDEGMLELPMNQRIVFSDTHLSDIFKLLERWYDVKFQIEDGVAKDLLVTLTTSRGRLSDILEKLERISLIKFSYIEDKKVVIVTKRD